MARHWTRRLAILVAVLLAAATAQVLHRVADDPGSQTAPAPQPTPDQQSQTPTQTPVGCARDPANLPPPPPGPDGRPANYLHTCGNRLFDSNGREVKIAGVNWSGMESGTYAPHGLSHRNWREILDQVAALGYNTIRLPFSNEALEPGRQVSGIDFGLNPELQGLSGLETLDLLVAGARERGLKVILDRHKLTANSYTTLWYNEDVPEDRWIADWQMLAARYYGDDTVIAADLHNEPHGNATWGTDDPATDWRLAAQRAGNAVLEVNPYLLVFVEGVGNHNGEHFWWGGELQGVRSAPVRLAVPNRLVYSPHDYGPAVSSQKWFWDPRFPANLPAIWDQHWGYIHHEGIAPVVVGEFGGRSLGDDRDGQWQKALLAYVQAHDMGTLVWSLNPNWDTGGVLADDWRSVERAKHEEYRKLLAAPLDTGALGTFGLAPQRFRVLFDQRQGGDETSTVDLAFRIVNDGPDSPNLSRFELRLRPSPEGNSTAWTQVTVYSQEPAGEHVLVDTPSGDAGGHDRYVRVRFDRDAGVVGRYARTGEVLIRIRQAGSWEHDRSEDGDRPDALPLHLDPGRWACVALYLDGRLVWGRAR